MSNTTYVDFTPSEAVFATGNDSDVADNAFPVRAWATPAEPDGGICISGTDASEVRREFFSARYRDLMNGSVYLTDAQLANLGYVPAEDLTAVMDAFRSLRDNLSLLLDAPTHVHDGACGTFD